MRGGTAQSNAPAPLSLLRRTLFTLAAAVSAIVFVAACVLWARSYWGVPGPRVFDSWRREVQKPADQAWPGDALTCYFSERLFVS